MSTRGWRARTTHKMHVEFERSVLDHREHVPDPTGEEPEELCARVEVLLRSGRLTLR